MITRRKVTAAVLLAGGVLLVATLFLLATKAKQKDGVSLLFQSYSERDRIVGNVAFLWLTNTSAYAYTVFTIPDTNIYVLDRMFWLKSSVLVNCEFSDKTSTGWTNSIQMPPSVGIGPNFMFLMPKSGFVVRIPLSPDGQPRKVAVLYRPNYLSPYVSFWISPAGSRVYRLLPKWLRTLVKTSQAHHFKLRKVWCDHELSFPPENR